MKIADEFVGVVGELFALARTYKVTFYEKTRVRQDDGSFTESYVLYKTINNAIFKKNSGGRNNISDKYKQEVEAIIVCDSIDISEAEIKEDSKITVEGYGDFKFIYADDIAGQHVVVNIYVKEWK